MKVKVTVDRIEEDTAVLLIRPEEDKKVDWPVKYLPEGIKEGDILDFELKQDKVTKKKKEEKVKNLIKKLQQKNN